MAKVALWFDSNTLTLNVNTTQMVMLSCKKILTPQNEVILRNEVVQRVYKAKLNGVIVDQHLNWKDHIGRHCGGWGLRTDRCISLSALHCRPFLIIIKKIYIYKKFM